MRSRARRVDQARALFDRFHQMITSEPGSPLPELGKLAVLAGVREFPTRVKCAGLAWHTLKAAVSEQPAGPITHRVTEGAPGLVPGELIPNVHLEVSADDANGGRRAQPNRRRTSSPSRSRTSCPTR